MQKPQKNADKISDFSTNAVSLFMILCSLLILSIGFILKLIKGNDERGQAELSRFYSKASIIAIKIVFAAFAIATAFIAIICNSLGQINFLNYLWKTLSTNYYEALQISFFVVTVYVVYSFRKHNIYFNYSTIDSEKYYQKVFRNIGKLSVYTLIYYAISLATFWVIVLYAHPAISLFVFFFHFALDLLAFYLILFFEIALVYLFCSFLEKCSYDNENCISKAPIIASIITFLFFAAYSVCALIISNNLQAGTTEDALTFSRIATPLQIFLKLYLLLFLTYFEYELRRNNKINLISKATGGIIFVSIFSFIINQFSSTALRVAIQIFDNPYKVAIPFILKTSTAVGLFHDVSIAIFLSLIIFALTKVKLIAKANKYVSIIFFVLIAVDVYIGTQSGSENLLSYSIYSTAKDVLCLMYLIFVVISTRKHEKQIEIKKSKIPSEETP